VELEKQQGKSSFDVEYGKDIIEVITYRNNSQTTTKIRMIEKMWVQNYLLKKLEEEEQLDSIPNALVFARTFDYNLRTKENYYSDRFFQNYWCIMLDLLRKEGIIEYCAGVIRKNE